MQEMPRFPKAPRPPDGFIKGAYWLVVCPASARNVGHISKFPGGGKINQAGPRNAQIGRKIGDISKYPTCGNINQASPTNATVSTWNTFNSRTFNCRKSFHKGLKPVSVHIVLVQKILTMLKGSVARRSLKFYVSVEENWYLL